MSSKNDLKRHSGETELAFINRLGRMKDSGLLDMTWTELSNIFNQELREPGQEYTESAYRKNTLQLNVLNMRLNAKTQSRKKRKN